MHHDAPQAKCQKAKASEHFHLPLPLGASTLVPFPPGADEPRGDAKVQKWKERFKSIFLEREFYGDFQKNWSLHDLAF